jgi:hypothetical protein
MSLSYIKGNENEKIENEHQKIELPTMRLRICCFGGMPED